MVRADTRIVGDRAEQLAFRYLRDRGLLPVTRNYRHRRGEVDLIMLDGDCLVFVEVRFRSSKSFAQAALTVDRHKQRKLACAAEMFLATRQAYSNHTTRFDVVGIDADANGGYSIEWLRDAFWL
ncbi:MAG: YraN family protein [Woeseiaceae bacterium]|nr:YraN family protein [Woeseiaceae bacterium]